MKPRILLASLVLSATGLMSTPARAQSVDPCTLYLCMAGISGFGASGGPGCVSAIAYWHTALAVYSPYFNPPASAALRKGYMAACPGATTTTNAAVFAAIMATWGWAP